MERGIVRTVPDAPVVTIVTDGWPSALIAAQALRMHVRAVYFPRRLHAGFDLRNYRVLEWKDPDDFEYRDLHGTTLILSGALSFVRRNCDRLTTVQSLILQVFTPMEGVSAKEAKRSRAAITAFMRSQDLQVGVWADARAGGCTDALYRVGFRSQFELDAVPTPSNAVERSLQPLPISFPGP